MINYKVDKLIYKNSKLINFSDCINEDLYDMYKDIPFKETGSINKLHDVNYEEFKKICSNMINEEYIINEEINTTTKRYILFINNKPIGEVGIRTTLNDFWVNRGSQIYYKIRKSERGKGYGNIILKLALKEAKKLGFKQIRINCDNNNIASKKIIINNGGQINITNYKTKEGFSSSYVILLDEN